jgi:hypothetical protein
MDEQQVASFQVFGCYFVLQVGQIGVDGGSGLFEFSRHVFDSFDDVGVHSRHVGGGVPESLLMRDVHTDAVFRRCGSLSIGRHARQETEKESEKRDRFHFRVPFAQRMRTAGRGHSFVTGDGRL